MTGLVAALSLGLRRAWSAPGRWLPAAGAVALAVATLGGLTAAGVVAGDHAARRTFAAAPDGAETVLLSWNGGAGVGVDARARTGLAAMGGGEVTRGLLMVSTRLDRGVVRLAAIAPLARWVRVLRGRLPVGECVPSRCEVVALDGAPPPAEVSGRGVRVVVVGSGRLDSRIPLGFAAAGPGAGAGARPMLLVSGDPGGMDALAGPGSVTRGQTWSAPLALRGLHAWDMGPALERIARGERILDRGRPGFTATTPAARLRAAIGRRRAAPARLRAAGAVASAALLAFLMLAAGALRGGLLAEDARARRGGATAAQRAALALGETAAPVAVGLVAGCALAVLVVVGRAAAGDAATSHVLDDAATGAAGRLPLVAGVAWAAILLAARAPGRAAGALAGGALIAAVAVLAGMLAPRGEGASDPLPDAVIPLAGAGAGLLVGLAAPWALRLLARAAPRRRPHARVALLELARDPGPAALAAAGLCVAVGLGGFAAAYRATLAHSRSAQAAHRVPLAATLTPGPSLASPLRVRSLAGWSALDGVRAAEPVVRSSDAAIAIGPQRLPVTLLGAPSDGTVTPRPPGGAGGAPGTGGAGAVPGVGGAGGASGAPTAARAVARAVLPAAARTVSLRAAAAAALDVSVAIRRRGDGVLDQVKLSGHTRPRGATLTGSIPASARGGTVIAVLLEPSSSLVATAGHQAAEEGTGSDVAAGSGSLGDLRADGTAVSDLSGWVGHGAARDAAATLAYRFGSSLTAIVRPPTPTDTGPLPVLVDRATYDRIGTNPFALDVIGTRVSARAVGVASRMPTVPAGQPFAVADAIALRDGLDADTPGAGEPRELWLAGDDDAVAASATAAARRAGVGVRTRAAVRHELDSEPISREVVGALLAVAILAAALAVAGVAVALRRAVRDGAHALLDLEAQGVGPAALRRGLRLRGIAIAVLGAAPGLALAIALSRLVTRAVRAGAFDAPPDPPLTSVVPIGTGLLAAAAFLIVAAALSALVVAPSLREPTPSAAPSAEGAG